MSKPANPLKELYLLLHSVKGLPCRDPSNRGRVQLRHTYYVSMH